MIVDFFNHGQKQGFYSLAWLEHHRPDVEWVTYAEWENKVDYSWLERRIDLALDRGQKVVLLPDEENILWPVAPALAQVINKYSTDPVYFGTAISPAGQLFYRHQHNLHSIPMLELQWWHYENCRAYLEITGPAQTFCPGAPNFMYLVARYEDHKFALGQAITTAGLRQHGLVTVSSDWVDTYPDNWKDFFDVNYNTKSKIWGDPWKSDSHLIHGKKVSSNVTNWQLLQAAYPTVPLVINAETSVGIFPFSEKSFWPILLGRLCMIFAQPGHMQNLQRYYSIDMRRYINTDYDLVPGWDLAAAQSRAAMMLADNQQLIRHAPDVYQELAPELNQASADLVGLLEQQFLSELAKIL